MKNKIIEILESLKFNGMAMALDSQIALAENGTAAPEIICNLLQEELRFRQERSMQNRLKNAKMPWEWTLNSFPFKKQLDVNKSQITTTRGGGLFLLVLEGTLLWALRNNYFPAEKHNLLLSDGFAYGNQKIACSRQFCWSAPCLYIIKANMLYFLFAKRPLTTLIAVHIQ